MIALAALVSSAYDDFTDLDDRRLIGIVRDVCHDLFGMRPKTSLECVDRVAEEVTHSDIRRRRGAPEVASFVRRQSHHRLVYLSIDVSGSTVQRSHSYVAFI